MKLQKIKSIKKLGVQKTLDLEVNHFDHNFYAEGIVVSNSLGTAFTASLTTLLKYKYPLEFYIACFNSLLAKETSDDDEDDEDNRGKSGKQGKIAQIKSELNYFGIKLLPPDLLKSHLDFCAEDGNIRYALGGIRSVQKETLSKIVKFRGDYTDKISCFITAKESGLNINNLCGLIQSGALGELGNSKSKLMLEAQTFNILSDNQKSLVKQYFEETKEDNILLIIKNLADRGIIKPKQFDTIKKKCAPFKKIYDENVKNQKMAAYLNEVHYLGFSYSHTLSEIFAEKNSNFRNIENFKDNNLLVGHVKKSRRCQSKKSGNKYYEFYIYDETGEVKGMLFENKWDLNEGFDKIKEDDIVTIKGNWTKEKNAIWIDTIVKQNYKAITSSRQIKDKEVEE